jgi:hypothetical protein
MSFRNHKHFADAQGRIRDLSLVISRRPWPRCNLCFKKRHTISDSWTTRPQINLIARYTGLFTRGIFLNFFLPQPIIHIATISWFQILKIIITESTMALSPVSLTLKQKIFCQFEKNVFTIMTKRLMWSSFWRAWKEFCRRCGCFQADGRHFKHLLH